MLKLSSPALGPVPTSFLADKPFPDTLTMLHLLTCQIGVVSSRNVLKYISANSLGGADTSSRLVQRCTNLTNFLNKYGATLSLA